ncbi:calcium-binding protein, partial [Methylibium rhizosphaerae]|uniref:calcium-binding protein n=1 Tax=Methylibium rhizosphaerae TaxID=2570323 RepID=UPI002483178D
DALGYVTELTYDGASRVVAQRRYAKAIDTTALGTQPSSSAIAPEPSDADRVTRKFYDADGLLRAELDAENYYTEYAYDAAGRLIAQTRFSTPMVGTLVNAYTPPSVVTFGMIPPATAYVVRQIDLRDSSLFHPAALASQFEALKAVNEAGAFRDLVALIRSAGPALKLGGFDAMALLRAWTRNLPADAPIRATLTSLGVMLSGTGGASSDIFVGDSSNNSFGGGEGVDLIDGGAGNDSLSGDNGNDTLDGGLGNDSLSGGSGADTYLFGLGSGQDTISNSDGDALGTNADTIVLGAGITPANITLTRSADTLVISLNGTDDRLSVSNYFQYDGTSANAVEAIRFADGTSWSIADVKARAIASTTGDDGLTGYATNDALS